MFGLLPTPYTSAAGFQRLEIAAMLPDKLHQCSPEVFIWRAGITGT
jgi:hypothetical protein